MYYKMPMIWISLGNSLCQEQYEKMNFESLIVFLIILTSHIKIYIDRFSTIHHKLTQFPIIEINIKYYYYRNITIIINK